MSAITVIDNALDRYVAKQRGRGIEPEGVRVRTLAHLAEVTNGEMSTMLQTYRMTQKRDGATRYVLACQEYGRNARWRILAKPGTDPMVVREARRQQAEWAIEDLTRRWFSDLLHELQPGLRDTELDDVIRDEAEFVGEQLELIRKRVERRLTRQAV